MMTNNHHGVVAIKVASSSATKRNLEAFSPGGRHAQLRKSRRRRSRHSGPTGTQGRPKLKVLALGSGAGATILFTQLAEPEPIA